jgi:hypothetical protein
VAKNVIALVHALRLWEPEFKGDVPDYLVEEISGQKSIQAVI